MHGGCTQLRNNRMRFRGNPVTELQHWWTFARLLMALTLALLSARLLLRLAGEELGHLGSDDIA